MIPRKSVFAVLQKYSLQFWSERFKIEAYSHNKSMLTPHNCLHCKFRMHQMTFTRTTSCVLKRKWEANRMNSVKYSVLIFDHGYLSLIGNFKVKIQINIYKDSNKDSYKLLQIINVITIKMATSDQKCLSIIIIWSLSHITCWLNLLQNSFPRYTLIEK